MRSPGTTISRVGTITKIFTNTIFFPAKYYKNKYEKKFFGKKSFFSDPYGAFLGTCQFSPKNRGKTRIMLIINYSPSVYDLRPRFSCNEIISEYPKYSILSRVARFCMQGCQFCGFYSIFGDFFLDITH